MRISQASASSKPAGDRHPVDGPDNRPLEAVEGFDHIEFVAGGHVSGEAGIGLAQLLQVQPGAEGALTRAGQNDHPNLRVAAQLFQRLDQPQPQLARQGVHGPRTVEGQGGDGVVCIDQKRGV